MKALRLLILGFLTLLSPIALSDTLLIEVINNEPANTEAGLLRPTQGMNMAQVKATFGAAQKEHAAVGEPPITRWAYKAFSVYFEHKTVLHSVVNKPTLSPQQ